MHIIMSNNGNIIPDGQVVVFDTGNAVIRPRTASDPDSAVCGVAANAATFNNFWGSQYQDGQWVYQYGYFIFDANLNIVYDTNGNPLLNPDFDQSEQSWAYGNYNLVCSTGVSFVLNNETIPANWVLLQNNANLGTSVYQIKNS